jgi:hypothetical protein
LVETCPACGGFNRAERPFYVWLIGGAIVLALILAFGDFGALIQGFGNLTRLLHPAKP